jgi:hypothetical protein
MSSRKVTIAAAVGVPAAILSAVLAAYVWGIVSGYRAILSGPTTDAVVTGVERCTARAWQCSPRSGVAIQLRFATPRGRQLAYAAAAEPLPIGKRVPIRYDPDKPDRRVLIVDEWERERAGFGRLAAVVGGILALGAIGVAVVLWSSRRREPRADLITQTLGSRRRR